MKYKVLAWCLILLLAASASGLESIDKHDSGPRLAASVDYETWIDANLILMFVTNTGSFAYDNNALLGKSAGMYYPYTSLENIANGSMSNCPIYAGSIWAGAIDVDTGDTLITSGQHDTDWGPGPIVNEAAVPGATSNPRYRVYKLYVDSLADNPNKDYLDWPVADGAPVDTDGNPEMIGDQMCWSVYNDLNVGRHVGNMGTVGEGLGLEVRHTAFAYDRVGALANIVFMRFRIYNKGGHDLENVMISVWSDPDLGEASDDLVGCDITRSLGYCYNEGPDADYGAAPPAVGYDFFQGPLISTGDNDDTAKMWNTSWVGYLNMGMTSFNKYINGTDPSSPTDTWEYMNGLDASKDPTEPVVDPTTGDTTKFFGTGDPVAGTGFLDANSDDRRWMQTTGPFELGPGDSTEILVAILCGQGSGPLSSISTLKLIDDFAQKVYDNDFVLPAPPAPPNVSVSELDRTLILSWDKTSELNPGDYTFEGYALMQSASENGPWTDTLGWFDIVNEHAAVIDSEFNMVAGAFLPIVAKPGKNNGLRYYYRTTRDVTGGGNLVNNWPYYYKVEAYSVDIDQPPGEKVLTSATTLTAMPHHPVGSEFNASEGDTLAVTKLGLSDGSVTVGVVDPSAITEDTYTVEFSTDPDLGPVWHLLDGAGDTILANQTNQGAEGDANYLVSDGIQIVVRGPAPGVKTGDMFDNPDDESVWGWDIPYGTRRFTWANADGFGWEGFRGALGWGGPGDYHGFGGADPVDPALLPNVELRLATVDVAGNFDVNDSNVSYAYRYIRNKCNDPARPEFAAHYTQDAPDPDLGCLTTYGYQDFEKSCPLSAWNMETDPPTRLAVGYLENNAALATLDGVYFPAESDSLGAWGTDNTAAGGPREWLWIFLDDYSETANPAYQLNAIDDPMPIMYWLTVARRGHDVPFSPDSSGQDAFLIKPTKVNSAAVTFSFSTEGFSAGLASPSEELLESIRAVPNPYYLYSGYDTSPENRVLKFTNLPAECTITIYNLAGDLVRTIEKTDATAIEAYWDVENEAGVPVGSGIYIYVVDAPRYGQKIGKMAIFTEVEVLDQF